MVGGRDIRGSRMADGEAIGPATAEAASGATAIARAWACLEGVPDPEIPVISLVDLGVIRAIDWRGEALEVAVTPTYTGCPATAVIDLMIAEALRADGFAQVRLRRRLAPAWTTAWISEKGRAALRAYGIAPPEEGTAACAGLLAATPRVGIRQPVAVDCPRCGSERTQCISPAGSTPCKASYRCESCLEPFDYFKAI